MSPRKPCKACPWRVGAKAADIPNFDLSSAKALCAKRLAVMACHEMPADPPAPCAGWMLRVGIPGVRGGDPGMRLLFIMARIEHTDYALGGAKLHETADEMRSAIVDSAFLSDFVQLDPSRRAKLLRDLQQAHFDETGE